MNILILATNNIYKIAEMSAILSGLDVEIISAGGLADFPNIVETGETLEQNAAIKVMAIWEKYRNPCLADDTGLEVDYLDGAPGVYSARFAGEGCAFDDNNRKLLGLLQGVPPAQRTAHFRTVIGYIGPDGEMHLVDGVLRGSITTEPRGQHGFGYDPIFLVEGTGRTLAEFSPSEKNLISHRSRALANIRPLVQESIRRARGLDGDIFDS